MKPLPLLTLIVLALPCPARAQESDPFAGDARLLKKHTIKAAGVPLKELLEQLTKETGISLTAGPRVAEDKVVLFAHDRPLLDSLRVIAKFFNFYWGKTGQPASYTLSQSLKQQQAEQNEIDQAFLAAAEKALQEIMMISELAKLTPEARKALKAQSELRLLADQDPVKQSELRLRVSLVSLLEGDGSYEMGAELLGGLNREDIAKLMRSGRTDSAWPPMASRGTIPTSVREKLVSAAKARHAERTDAPLEFNSVYVSISGRVDPELCLEGNFMVYAKSGAGTTGYGFGFRFPHQIHLPGGEHPVEQVRSYAGALLKGVTLKYEAAPFGRVERTPLKPPLIARILSLVVDNGPIDFISDAFYSSPGPGKAYRAGGGTIFGSRTMEINNQPLGDALTVISKATRHRWNHAGGFVQLKSVDYARLRLSEPSTFNLRKWSALKPADIYSLDMMAEIADQPYSNFLNSVDALVECGALNNSERLEHSRNSLLFWNMLTPVQRQKALTPDGLPYRALSQKMRQAYEMASLDRLASEGSRSGKQERQWPKAELEESTLTVKVDHHELWGIQTEFGHSATSGSREAAFNSLRNQDPGLTMEKLKPGRSIRIRFEYASSGFRTMNMLGVPIIWAEDEPQSGK